MKPPEHLKKPDTPDQEQKPAEFSGTFIEKTISGVLLNVLKTDEGRLFLESLIQPMNKSVAGSGASFEMNSDKFINALFKINTFGNGEKGPASCGHIVTVQYKILSLTNTLLEENTATFPLGSNKIAPGLDAVIVGMKTGQTRHATISSKYFPETYSNKLSAFKVNVLLKEIMPENFVDNNVKIFDDQLSYKIPLFCGGKAVYDAKITKLSDGKVIYNSVDTGKKISMQIGNLAYPMIFSHSLHNKIPVGNRTVIAKGKLFKSYASNFSTIFPENSLPEDEYFMVEFFNFDNQMPTPGTTLDKIQGLQNDNMIAN
ncbi:FKBP-type peptidyl-prolyl cis-trans isomerase [Candidatus Megaera venefica]|nr:FKBP-type peptidyl-prolyl cis-trans isomerase [Candidatus Megaera venefica]